MGESIWLLNLCLIPNWGEQQDWAATAKDLDSLESWTNRNLVLFRQKWKVLHLERNTQVQHYRLGSSLLGRNSTELIHVGVLVDTKMNVGQQCIIMQSKLVASKKSRWVILSSLPGHLQCAQFQTSQYDKKLVMLEQEQPSLPTTELGKSLENRTYRDEPRLMCLLSLERRQLRKSWWIPMAY